MIELNNNKPIAILGNPNTGKTNLMFFLASLCSAPKKYLLGYPKKMEGYINLSDIKDLARLENCTLLIDELDQLIPIYEKKSNEALKRLLKFTAHNNIKLVFTTQLSQFITKMMEALVPCWAITELDIFSLKNGSKPKRILLDYLKMPHIINAEIGMKLPQGQFCWYQEQAEPGTNGVYSFQNMNVGKDWGNNKKPEIKELIQAVKNPE